MKYTIAAAQMDSGGDTERNLVKVENCIRMAAENGARLILFPEHAEYLGKDYISHAVPVPGEITRFYSSCARRYGVYVHSGTLTEKREAGYPYNTSLLFAPDGSMAGAYRKLHMFDVDIEDGPGYQESSEASPGDEIVLCDTELGRIGLAVCYDLRFPELFRIMAGQGAELMVLAANFTHNTGKDHWETLVRARAVENSCYVAAVGQCGQKDDFMSYGHSAIVDPWGVVLAMAGVEEEIIYADIDTERICQVRRQIPSLSNVRSDVYRLESERCRVYGTRNIDGACQL